MESSTLALKDGSQSHTSLGWRTQALGKWGRGWGCPFSGVHEMEWPREWERGRWRGIYTHTWNLAVTGKTGNSGLKPETPRWTRKGTTASCCQTFQFKIEYSENMWEKLDSRPRATFRLKTGKSGGIGYSECIPDIPKIIGTGNHPNPRVTLWYKTGHSALSGYSSCKPDIPAEGISQGFVHVWFKCLSIFRKSPFDHLRHFDMCSTTSLLIVWHPYSIQKIIY